MKRVLTFIAASLTLCLSAAPAQADNDTKSMAKSAVWFPVQVTGVAAALVIGTPIACARRTGVRIREYNERAADKIGGHEHGPPNLFASVFSIPAGTLVGISEGIYAGGKNAINHGVEKPFGVDSFSLGDDLDS